MADYLGQVMRDAAGWLISKVGLFFDCIVALAFILILFNKKWADQVSGFHGVPQWYAAFPIVALLVFAIFRAQYQLFVEMKGKRDKLQTQLTLRSPAFVIIFTLRASFQKSGWTKSMDK